MKNVDHWPALYASEDLPEVRMLATCLSAMDFEVAVEEDASTAPDGRSVHARLGGGSPHVVRVRAEDHDELSDLLEEILSEQDEFDAAIESWHTRANRTERRLLVTMIIIVSALGVAGAIEL